ncbi:unnamed protein product [Allacma fusca]|uniref:Uncharacterized protein n=1 Tax=Allacma fusca TaxID=39272 RepID=A0A8J2JJ52_9HEXA|nr:unnamed protein product [Allacma fusca]
MDIMDQKITASTNRMEQMESKITAITASTNRMEQMESIHTALSVELKDLNSRLIKNSRDFEKAELYEDENFYGKVFRIDNKNGANCFNADYEFRIYRYGYSNFINTISSIKLNGNCVRLYNRRGCTGNTLELSPGSREDCQKNLDNCNWNDITASVSFCSYLPSSGTSWKASRGGACKDECLTRGKDYFWCHLNEGSWDYCSPGYGQDYRGDVCDEECAFNGTS